jgi:predicted ester cyclase
MHDTPLDFSGAPLSHQKAIVRTFNQDMWNRADSSLVPGIFHPDFTFRGSLDQVFGKLRFHGVHRKELLGVPPTGRHVWWHGAPVFTFEDGLVRDLWVLGDVHGLLQRLRGES